MFERRTLPETRRPGRTKRVWILAPILLTLVALLAGAVGSGAEAPTSAPPESGARPEGPGLDGAPALVGSAPLQAFLWRDVHSANLATGDFGEFDSTSILNGNLMMLEPSTRWPGEPSTGRFARASIDGGGKNGYARAEWRVNWGPGTVFRTESSFYLPNGFYRDVQGSVQIVGWDTYPVLENQMRLIVVGADHHARLFLKSDGVDTRLTNDFDFPEGRWVRLALEQRISPVDGWSRVYLDDRLVASGRGTTATPYQVTRIRYGLVAIHAGDQLHDLSLHFGAVRLSQPG